MPIEETIDGIITNDLKTKQIPNNSINRHDALIRLRDKLVAAVKTNPAKVIWLQTVDTKISELRMKIFTRM